jgi:hypothetical protein
MDNLSDVVHSIINLPQASQAAPLARAKVAGLVSQKPTQAKTRLEWATQSFVAGAEGEVRLLLQGQKVK